MKLADLPVRAVLLAGVSRPKTDSARRSLAYYRRNREAINAKRKERGWKK